MDIFSASDFYSDNLKFVETEAHNYAFDFYGIGDKTMLVISGSYFVLQFFIFAKRLSFYSLNKFATLNPSNHYFRLMGIYFDVSGNKN